MCARRDSNPYLLIRSASGLRFVSAAQAALQACCNTVASASRDGDRPGRPRTPNAAANFGLHDIGVDLTDKTTTVLPYTI